MKPKTQIITGFCSAAFLMGYYIFNIFYQRPLRLSRTWNLFIFIAPFVALTAYLISIIRKDLKTINIIFGIWQIFAVIILFFLAIVLGLVVISSGEINYKGIYRVVLVIFLYYAILYGISTLIIWMGLKGLKRNIKDKY